MSKKYIDTEDFKSVIKANDWSNSVVPDVMNLIIDRMPAADVAEVVRCKDCKFCHKYFKDKYMCERGLPAAFEITTESFCSYGERSEQ